MSGSFTCPGPAKGARGSVASTDDITLCRNDGSPSAFSEAFEKVANTSRPVRHECATGAPQVCGAPPPQEQMLYRNGRRVADSAAPMRV
jgi:hypothetical protein